MARATLICRPLTIHRSEGLIGYGQPQLQASNVPNQSFNTLFPKPALLVQQGQQKVNDSSSSRIVLRIQETVAQEGFQAFSGRLILAAVDELKTGKWRVGVSRTQGHKNIMPTANKMRTTNVHKDTKPDSFEMLGLFVSSNVPPGSRFNSDGNEPHAAPHVLNVRQDSAIDPYKLSVSPVAGSKAKAHAGSNILNKVRQDVTRASVTKPQAQAARKTTGKLILRIKIPPPPSENETADGLTTKKSEALCPPKTTEDANILNKVRQDATRASVTKPQANASRKTKGKLMLRIKVPLPPPENETTGKIIFKIKIPPPPPENETTDGLTIKKPEPFCPPKPQANASRETAGKLILKIKIPPPPPENETTDAPTTTIPPKNPSKYTTPAEPRPHPIPSKNWPRIIADAAAAQLNTPLRFPLAPGIADDPAQCEIERAMRSPVPHARPREDTHDSAGVRRFREMLRRNSRTFGGVPRCGNAVGEAMVRLFGGEE